MLTRLGVNQKLSLLLLVPLAALVCTLIPLTVQRMDTARAGAAAAATARLGTNVGVLLQDLQDECTLGLAYLVSSGVEPAAVLAQQRRVDDAAAAIREANSDPDVLAAVSKLAELNQTRARILDQSTNPQQAFQVYAGVINALLSGLHLPSRFDLDAAGLRAMDRLDALLRENADIGQIEAGLVMQPADPDTAAALIAAGQIDEERDRDRFVELADQQQQQVEASVVDGLAGQGIASLASHYAAAASGSRADPLSSPAQQARSAATLSLVESYARLRRLLTERVAGDAAAAANDQAVVQSRFALAAALITVLVLVTVVVTSVRVGRSIVSPLRRLARAAGAVADIANAELVRVGDSDDATAAPPRLAAVNVRGQDEVGELGAAINRVQATAALMLERQVSTQANVAVMFANIAYRTQTLVSRQISLIDDMERGEPDPEILAKLYRLDHVTARLRRSADSLLVVSGTRDIAGTTNTAVVDVIRAAMAEIEGFQGVRLGPVPDAFVAAELANDLRLLLAELLENATSFSPPQTLVDVTSDLTLEGCRVTIVDHGMGMSANRIDEENQRVLERPRLDVVPTEFLGLFVVGRLARRHGLTVRFSATPVQGVTVAVIVPARFLTTTRSTGAQPVMNTAPVASPPAPGSQPSDDGPFTWFGRPPGWSLLIDPVRAVAAIAGGEPSRPRIEQVAANGGGESRNGLYRRTPGTHGLDLGLPVGDDQQRPARAQRDAAGEAAQLDAYAQGIQHAQAARRDAGLASVLVPDAVRPTAEWSPAAAQPRATHHGLVRRVPGSQLHPELRRASAPKPMAPHQPENAHRDPESERSTLDDFTEGLARAQHPHH